MENSADLLNQVRAFLERSSLLLSPQARVLDICSELGEVFDSLSGKGDLSEELGDLLYSTLSLCCELEIDALIVTAEKGTSPTDLAVSLGRLAKEALKATNYGRAAGVGGLDGLRVVATDFAAKVFRFTGENMIDPGTALSAVLAKYEARLKRGDSAGSGR